jgi:hypothetical protein
MAATVNRYDVFREAAPVDMNKHLLVAGPKTTHSQTMHGQAGRLHRRTERPWAPPRKRNPPLPQRTTTPTMSDGLEREAKRRGADALRQSQGSGTMVEPCCSGGELSKEAKWTAGTRRRSGEPRYAGAGCATPGLDGISNTDRGWTVFRIPSSPGSLPSVQSWMCGPDNSEIVSYLHPLIPPPLTWSIPAKRSPRAAPACPVPVRRCAAGVLAPAMERTSLLHGSVLP